MAQTQRTIPLYELPEEATSSDVAEWCGQAARGEGKIKLPCVLEFGGEIFHLRDRADCELVSQAVCALWPLARSEANKTYDRWLRKAWDTFERFDKARKYVEAMGDFPTVDDSDSWWAEDDVTKDPNHPNVLRVDCNLDAEERRAAIKGPPRKVPRP